MAYLRHLNLFFELRQIIERCLIHGQSVLATIIRVTFKAKCESGTSEGIHCECNRILSKCIPIHSMDTK